MALGLGGIAVALLIIAGALKLMPLSLQFMAAGLVLLAIALQGIVLAVQVMGGMSMEEIGKGLSALAASLGILALGLILCREPFLELSR